MGTPIPNRSKETSAQGAGPVTTYFLPKNEMPSDKKPATNSDGIAYKPPVGPPEAGQEHSFSLSKKEYLKLRLSGSTRKEIAKAEGISTVKLTNYYLQKGASRIRHLKRLLCG